MAELVVFLSCAIGNLIFPAVAGQEWGAAIERTLFQAMALLCVWLIRR